MYITAGAYILVSALLCSAVADTTVKPVDTTNDDINSVDFKHQNPTDVAKQIWEKRCGRQYNIGCLKMDLVKLIDRLDENTNFQILPGVSIVRSASSGIGMPTEMLLGKPDSFLDNYLVSKFTNYLSTLTINVKILDPALVSTAKSFGEGIFGADPETTGTARRKNRFGQTMAVAGMMSGATLLAMGMSALAAMAGKALMTSLLSLMLSAISALKGHGDGHKSTTYEIVTRPVVTHAHSHSSEVQHLTGHGGHTAHDGGYGYARSMASTPVQPVVQDEIYQKYTKSIPDAEGDRMAYRAHEPLPSYASLPTVS